MASLAVGAVELAALMEGLARGVAAGQMLSKEIADARAAGRDDISDEAVDRARAFTQDKRASAVDSLGFDPLESGDPASGD